MQSTTTSAPIAHAFDSTIQPTRCTPADRGYHVGQNTLRFALIFCNEVGAVLVSGQLMIATLTANEKTALFRHLRAVSANEGGEHG